jgi:hypothetical protein
MTDWAKLFKALLVLILLAFTGGVMWGACVVGARLVQRLVE